jgi:hypothetical protein
MHLLSSTSIKLVPIFPFCLCMLNQLFNYGIAGRCGTLTGESDWQKVVKRSQKFAFIGFVPCMAEKFEA